MASCAQYSSFNEMASKMAEGNVDLIRVDALSKALKNNEPIILLDARELEEFQISHIENSVFIGYDNFNQNLLNTIPKESKIVVYCSVGYISCKIGEKIKEMGFVNVYNLYGGIFDWANQNQPLVNNENEKTNKIHGYNENWSKWIKQGKVVY